MPYKYNTKTFTLKERHPISKVRFENATKFIVNELTSHSSDQEDKGLYKGLNEAVSIWEQKRNKLRHMRIIDSG
jgi:hypothetical protein